MSKFKFENPPALRILSEDQVTLIHENALQLLEETGIFFDSEEAVRILKGAGCRYDQDTKTIRFPSELVLSAIASAPETLMLYDRDGNAHETLGGNKTCFYPGSCPKSILEGDGKTVRDAQSGDMRALAKIAENLVSLDFVSTSMVCNDAPMQLGDQYIYYNVMRESTKPIIGGAVDIPGVARTFELLKAIRGSEAEARQKPYTVFDVCPTTPLRFSDISSANIIDSARYEIPISLICASIAGVNTPVTLAGAVLQHTVETLAGLTLAQVVKRGIPVVYGGAPCIFNMKTMYTPMASMESNMIAAAYALMGKFYGLPTHTYAALSDSKTLDYQAGAETMRSALMAVQAGINNVAGAGGLNVIAEQSPEKLVLDADVISLVKQYAKGIRVDKDTLAKDVIAQMGPGGECMQSDHTLQWFRKVQNYNINTFNFAERTQWERDGHPSITDKAKQEMERIAALPSKTLDQAREKALEAAFREVCKDAGIEDQADRMIAGAAYQ